MNIKKLTLIVLAALAAEGPALNAQPDTNAPAANPAAPTVTLSASTNATAAAVNNVTMIADTSTLTPTNEVRMNFQDAPLSTILKYLSARMGFVIAADVDIHGTATIVSEQPVNKDEVIGLLSTALTKNGYSVARNGRLLAITTMESAATGSETPVLQALSPTNVPMTEEMATVILPVQSLNPVQLVKDLDQLIPSGAKVTANEAGNAVIMTAREKDIHRFSEIISALDTSSVSEVKVFILTNADAKSVASELKEVFQSPDSSVARDSARSQRFRGFGFGGGGPFGGGGGSDSSSSDQKNGANKAVFVSDDQMNAVVASAPPSYFPEIMDVITNLDQPSEDITEIQTYHLKYADAQETADELSNLFPDDTKTSSDQSSSRGYSYRFFTPPWMQSQGGGSSPSERMKRQTSVRAVPDLRTHSVTVTASKAQLVLISKYIEDLDNDPAMVQRVYVYDIDNADPTTVQSTMSALFAGPNTKAQPTTSTSALEQRETSAAQQQTQSSTGFGSSTGTSALH